LEHAVGQSGQIVSVGHREDGHLSLIPQLAEKLENFLLGEGVEIAGGLVQKQQGRAVLEGAGESHAALLAAGQLLRKGVPSPAHAQAGEQFFGAIVGFARGVAREDSRKGGVIEGGQPRKQGVGLQKKTDPPGTDPAQVAPGKRKQIRSLQFQGTLIRPGQGAEQGHERGFAGTGTSADGDELRGADFQRDGLHGRHGAAAGRINPGKVAGAQDGLHSRPSRMS